MVQETWQKLPNYYSGINIDEYIVMPNHFHGIIVLNGRPQGGAPTLSLSDIIHRFKSLTTSRYHYGVKNDHWSRFPGRLWQRSYHDHIIRNEKSLSQIRQYIQSNPGKWDLDRNNPKNFASNPFI